MTSKLTNEQMLERARENVKALKMASRQHAFESAREEILADLQIAEYALACLEGVDSEPVGEFYEDGPLNWYQISDGDRLPSHRRIPLYRHAQPEKKAPDCANAEFGTYSGQINVIAPNGKVAGIDSCILSEVLGLWGAGITTIESCCGHSKASSYIAVAEKDAGKMRGLGYELDESHPSGCVFYSKTSRHGRVTQPAPVVPGDVLDALQKVARIRLDLNDFDGDRRGIADCLGDAEEALIEVVNRRAAMLNGGKS
ncbi:hypothetical protein [Klebsiella michiganensis]|uniref:hypothetical protein n=1 Tax=Klebsiella michiganensis TaxID=1134687 RepID=UPI003132FB66